MRRFGLSVLFAVAACTVIAYTTGVHVRVSPSVKTGIEAISESSTIQIVLDHHFIPTPNRDGTSGRVFIEIAPATYHERLVITQHHPNITLIGTCSKPNDVLITDSLNTKQVGGTFFTATITVESPGFQADTSPSKTLLAILARPPPSPSGPIAPSASTAAS
jgi:pectinesterase